MYYDKLEKEFEDHARKKLSLILQPSALDGYVEGYEECMKEAKELLKGWVDDFYSSVNPPDYKKRSELLKKSEEFINKQIKLN